MKQKIGKLLLIGAALLIVALVLPRTYSLQENHVQIENTISNVREVVYDFVNGDIYIDEDEIETVLQAFDDSFSHAVLELMQLEETFTIDSWNSFEVSVDQLNQALEIGGLDNVTRVAQDVFDASYELEVEEVIETDELSDGDLEASEGSDELETDVGIPNEVEEEAELSENAEDE